MAVLNKGVINNTKKEQGYDLTTSYAVPGNLRDRGYSDSTAGYGASGLTGSKLRSYSPTLTTPTVSSTGSSRSGVRRVSTAKAVPVASSANSYTEATPAKQYGGDYDILTGEYIGPGSSTPSYDAAGAYKKLLEAYRNSQSNYQSYLDNMNNAAQSAYDKGISSLNETYDKMMGLLSGAYDTQKNTLAENRDRALASLLEQYNNSKSNVSSNAENSLKQAYISNMLAKRDIAQKLSAMGLNGGMTETTLAGMANQYGNRRNDINKTLNTNLANLATNYNNSTSEIEGNYGSSLADALSAYNSQVANANAQRLAQVIELENALANNKMNAYANYQNMLDAYNQNYYNLLRNAIADQVDLSSIM